MSPSQIRMDTSSSCRLSPGPDRAHTCPPGPLSHCGGSRWRPPVTATRGMAGAGRVDLGTVTREQQETGTSMGRSDVLVAARTGSPGHHLALLEVHSASGSCRICKWSGRAGRPTAPVHSQEPRLLARAARSLMAGSARRADGVNPALGALRRSGAGLCRGATLRACRRAGAPREESDAARRTDLGWRGGQVACPGLGCRCQVLADGNELPRGSRCAGASPRVWRVQAVSAAAL